MRWEESRCTLGTAGNLNIPDGTASELTYVCPPLVLNEKQVVPLNQRAAITGRFVNRQLKIF